MFDVPLAAARRVWQAATSGCCHPRAAAPVHGAVEKQELNAVWTALPSVGIAWSSRGEQQPAPHATRPTEFATRLCAYPASGNSKTNAQMGDFLSKREGEAEAPDAHL